MIKSKVILAYENQKSEIINHIGELEKKHPQELEAIKLICKYLNVDYHLVFVQNSAIYLAYIRYGICFFLYTHLTITYKKISFILRYKKRDHTNIIHAISSHSDNLIYDEGYREMWSEVQFDLVFYIVYGDAAKRRCAILEKQIMDLTNHIEIAVKDILRLNYNYNLKEVRNNILNRFPDFVPDNVVPLVSPLSFKNH